MTSMAISAANVTNVFAAPTPPVCMDAATHEHLRKLIMESLDDALRDYVKHLFTVWTRDDQLDQQRITQGLRNSLRAWTRARHAVERWNVPECNHRG